MKLLYKRLLTVFLAIMMLFSVCGDGLSTFATGTQENNAYLLPVQDPPDMDYVEGTPYISITTASGSVEESGSYLLTIRRTGDISVGSTVELRTVDMSASYGLDYEIDDPVWETAVFPQAETLLQQCGNEANRIAAAQILEEIGQRISESTAEEDTSADAGSAVTTEPVSELARLKMEQSGLPVRQTTEDTGDMLPPELQSLLTEATDIADVLDASSVTRLTFSPGETEKTVRFRVLDDDISEGQEIIYFLLAFSDDVSALVEATRGVNVIIEDDEPVEHSKVFFTQETYSAGTDKVTLVLNREEAEYTYASVGVRTVDGTAVGGVNYESLDITVNFAQFQTDATVEIPVTPGCEQTDFSVELYDYKGIDPGETTVTRVTVPGCVQPDGNATLMDDKKTVTVWVDGRPRSCEVGSFDSNGWAPVTCEYSGRSVEVGKYRLATALNYNTFQGGKGSMTQRLEDKYYHLKVYNSNLGSLGKAGASFRVFSDEEPSRYYASMYVEYETFSNAEGSVFSLYSRQGYNKSFVTGKHGRTVGLGVTIPNFNDRYPKYGDETCEIQVEKTKRTLNHPDANIYGFVMLYQPFDISVVDPDPMKYASGTFDETGKRVMEERRPAHTYLQSPSRLYSKQYFTIGEEPAEGNNGYICGELTGYYITPNGGNTFFYETNSKTLCLDRNLITLINDNSAGMMPDIQVREGQCFRDLHTSVTIKPVYKYKDVVVELQAPTINNDFFKGGVTYLDRDLQTAWTGSSSVSGVFHVGDKLNPSVKPGLVKYSHEGYWRFQYDNPGDTDPSFEDYVTVKKYPYTMLSGPRLVLRPVITDVINCIDIRMDENAQKYFAISGLVKKEDLTEPFMKGKNILNTGTVDSPDTMPLAGQAYTVLLTKTSFNDGTWRPKITRELTGVTVNGYAFDFLAADNPAGNVIEVTAEKIDPAAMQYYAVTGRAVYQSYSVRQSSASLTGIPAVGAIVLAGGETINRNTVRMNSATDDDGMFTIAGLRARPGDTVSVLIDNNDIRQVAYVKLDTDKKEQMAVETLIPVPDKPGYTVREQKKTVFLQDMPVTAMPIRTGYSPYVTFVSYNYLNEDIVSTQPNEFPIKGGASILNLSVYVNLNGLPATDVTVTVIKQDVLGIESTCVANKKSTSLWATDCWDASFTGESLHDGDEFWVQLTVGGKTGPKVKTGLTCYSPAEAPVEQRFTYDIPSPYDDLPILRTMTGKIDSGVCKWQTFYRDEKNPGSGVYDQLITMSITTGEHLNLGDWKGKKELLNKVKNQPGASAAIRATDGDIAAGRSPSEVAAHAAENTQNTLNAALNTSQGNGQKPKYIADLDGDGLAKLEEPRFTIRGEFLIMLTYDYDPVTATHFFACGQYLIAISGSVNSTLYWSVMGVPMYVNLTGRASIQLDGEYYQEREQLTAKDLGRAEDLATVLPTPRPYFQFTAELTAQPGVGVYGICGLRGVVDFAILARANYHTRLGGSYGTFSGGFGVDLVLLSFTKTWPTTLWKSGVFAPPGEKNAALMADAAEGDPVSVRVLDPGEERAQNRMLRSTLTPQTRTTLIDGAMEYVRPQLVDLGDGRTMLLFLRKTAESGRDLNNAATLVYAIRNSDGTWEKDANGNIASTAIELDGQADSVPAAYRVGDKVYIAWTNAEIVGADSFANASKTLQNTQIHLATYDIPTGCVSGPYAVTDDIYVNSYAHIIERKGYIVLYYFKRDIGQAQETEDLASLSSNYNTWALRIFDPATGSFIGEEELLYVKHPSVADPLVFNLETGQYTYTDSKGVAKKYGIISYIADTDGDLNTATDRELWAIVRNQTDDKAYYPVKIDSGKANISEARLTEQNGELYLTWLTDGSTLNTLCASDVWESLDNTFGNEDGSGDQTALDLIRGLSKDQICNYHWNQLPYSAQPEELRDGESYAVLANLAYERFSVIQHTLTDNDPASSGEVSRTLGNHRIVAGADGNLYYFWTEPSENGMGQDLYGATFYTDTASDDGSPRKTWSKSVQLTDYGLAIDELAITVNADGNATMIANLFEQFLDDEDGVRYGPYRLTEIDFVPGSSLVIEEQRILLSDEYPIPGETVTASFDVTNIGLLPADSFQLTLNDDAETHDQNVLPGDSVTLTTEKVAGDGALSFTARVQELDKTQLLTVKAGDADTATVTTKNGWSLDFGIPEVITYNEAADQIGPLLRELIEQSGKEWNDEEILSRVAASADPKYMAMLNTLNCPPEQRQKADLYVVVPVTNVGNQPAEDITFTATGMHEELSGSGDDTFKGFVEGEKAGSWTLDAAPVKTLTENGVSTKTVYVAIPLVDFNIPEEMNSLGRVEIKVVAEKDGEVIDDTLYASRQITHNVFLQVNSGADEIGLNTGEAKTLDVLEYPFNSLKRLSYEIEDGTVAAVTQDGEITGLREGTTVLTVSDVNQPRLKKQLNVTVKAAPADPMAAFSDLNRDAWYRDGVRWALTQGVMNGVGNGLFAPDGPTSRAMIVTMLYRMEDEPASDYAMTFRDVKSGQWYTEAIRWAAENGIVNGYSADAFGPADNVTREQIVTILMRYAKHKGVDTGTGELNPLTGFIDTQDISDWAVKAFRWAVDVGIINGTDDEKISPKLYTSRVQTATMLMRYCTRITD